MGFGKEPWIWKGGERKEINSEINSEKTASQLRKEFYDTVNAKIWNKYFGKKAKIKFGVIQRIAKVTGKEDPYNIQNPHNIYNQYEHDFAEAFCNFFLGNDINDEAKKELFEEALWIEMRNGAVGNTYLNFSNYTKTLWDTEKAQIIREILEKNWKNIMKGFATLTINKKEKTITVKSWYWEKTFSSEEFLWTK